MISPWNSWARRRAREVLPLAVGPASDDEGVAVSCHHRRHQPGVKMLCRPARSRLKRRTAKASDKKTAYLAAALGLPAVLLVEQVIETLASSSSICRMIRR